MRRPVYSTPIVKKASGNWVRINGQIFEIVRGDVQLSFGSHANMEFSIDISKNSNYYSIFIKLYEEQSMSYDKSKKFDVFHKKFTARGTLIKSMDVKMDDEMSLSMVCDLLEEVSDDIRRDILLNEILGDGTIIDTIEDGKTLPKDNNIT